MLSVPPAFVLSQDQTLYKSCIYQILSYLKYLSCSITLALLLRFFSLVLTFFFPNFLGKRNLKGRYFFLALFGFQDAVFALSCETALILYHIFLNLSSAFFKFFQILFMWPPLLFAEQLFYYITFPFVCQVLFSTFSNILLCDTRSSQSSFNIISLISGFVKYFFSKFLLLFPKSHLVLFTRPLRRQLLYYSTFMCSCQLQTFQLSIHKTVENFFAWFSK